MRYTVLLLSLWLLIPAVGATAQTPDTLAPLVKSTRLLFGKAWRVRAGDNPAWAQPGFDASAWDTLNLAQLDGPLPRATQAEVYWLRRRFRLADSLRQRALVFQLYRLGTADVYLNGRLLTDSTRRNRVRGLGQAPGLLEVPAQGPAVQVLAVRYRPWQPPRWLLGVPPGPRLSMRLLTGPQQQQGEAERATATALYWVMAAVFLLLALLHYTFYLYNPTQRANRYFARYALALSLSFGCTTYGGAFTALLPSWQWALAVWVVQFGLLWGGLLWFVRAVYALFSFRPGRVWAGLLLSGGVLLLAQLTTLVSRWYLYPLLVFGVLVLAEELRLTGQALRRRRRGAGLIAGGFAAGLLLMLGYIGLRVAGIRPPGVTGDLMLLSSVVFPALGISLFLAREFALDSELLLVKLGEVERLSTQTIAQEQEKQALLAAQNETLEQQVQQRTGELQRSLTDLRATQAQLIQKEKMASLGELTAGIAHEIQNPLNFVNNFSEVSSELMSELEEAQAAGDAEEVAALAVDVRQNLGKITEHGRRAAAIVRGMLEHSRTSAGERTPTDVNRLADEYLRLAYQGLRANDKTFNAALHTDFAPEPAPVNIVGADVGRVLLNLFGNAFYAVRQRQRAGEAGYAPTVSVSTQRVNGHVAIRVTDNGTGMSAAVQAKIFQPFFTTKPTGEGTGLGLSLSHDIIAQGHGGTLTVESAVGEGTAFTICLPTSPV
ncbi:MAG TPA: ATP-binding protein [Hymenobacter sp.]|jgi:signal transduction histidine kinase|uniref:sensor histidine kinase n=1 Tax=Hymenobacter sp. TaxID=1898978 RepID=UPI002ED97361